MRYRAVYKIPANVPRSISPRGVRLSESLRHAGPVAAWEFICAGIPAQVQLPAMVSKELALASADDSVDRLVTATCRAETPTGTRIARTACFANGSGRLIWSASPDYAHEVLTGASSILAYWFPLDQTRALPVEIDTNYNDTWAQP